MTKKTQRGLGRGLGALLGEAAEEDQVSQQADSREERVTRIPIEQIDPNREQPRKRFDEAALNELAQSIQAVGVLQPIIVARQGDRYQIIAGPGWRDSTKFRRLCGIGTSKRGWKRR